MFDAFSGRDMLLGMPYVRILPYASHTWDATSGRNGANLTISHLDALINFKDFCVTLK